MRTFEQHELRDRAMVSLSLTAAWLAFVAAAFGSASAFAPAPPSSARSGWMLASPLAAKCHLSLHLPSYPVFCPHEGRGAAWRGHRRTQTNGQWSMTVTRADLPITPLLPELITSLEKEPNLVLQAPPGAGKTTSVPLALLRDAAWMKANKGVLLVLEPRRIAARSAALRMAAALGEQVGETVGYRVRQESKVSKKSRIVCVTEGMLLRQLQSDPLLEGVAGVCFDEFHERSTDGDLCLALCREVQLQALPELRLLVMSATLVLTCPTGTKVLASWYKTTNADT